MYNQDELGRPFYGVEAFRGDAPAGYLVDWLGMLRSPKYENLTGYDEDRFATPGFPPPSEEYWEWVDIFDAVFEARERFDMFELGAGYGRWCIAAEGALRKLSPTLPRTYTAIEAEPTHYVWLREHFVENGIDPDRHRIMQSAVARNYGLASFAVGNATAWYGQAIIDRAYDPAAAANSSDPYIHVSTIPLSALLDGQSYVDLIDMDVQGVEFDIVDEAISELNRCVRRMHIGTHSNEIEDELRKLLSSHNWEMKRDYRCLSDNETSFGVIRFGDGVQTWLNPRLANGRPVSK